MSEPPVAVVGASGYVGSRLLTHLHELGRPVVAVTRRPPPSPLPVPTHAADELDSLPENLGPVVNLAHPRSVPPRQWPAANDALGDLLVRMTARSGRLIHVSTLSVFGDQLEYPVKLGPVPLRDALPYVKLKLALEARLLDELPGARVDVVRLGNIWGPDSPVWTQELARRLRSGRPVGLDDQDGYGNVTDIANTVDYLAHLIDREGAVGPGFHHLAELGGHRWSRFVEHLAQSLGVSPHRVSSPGNLPPHLRRLDGWFGLRAFDPLLRIMACPRRFETHVDDDWEPPVEIEAALTRATESLT